jgi:hypothetical protein
MENELARPLARAPGSGGPYPTLPVALQQYQHLPLLGMVVRPHIGLRLRHDHQALDLVAVTLMQQHFALHHAPCRQALCR